MDLANLVTFVLRRRSSENGNESNSNAIRSKEEWEKWLNKTLEKAPEYEYLDPAFLDPERIQYYKMFPR